jgi:serine/threonine protein kinase
MHDKEIIHRDLKPENTFLDRNLEPFLANLGSWKIVSDYGGDGVFLGPEVLTWSPPFDFRDSVYSFAIVIYMFSPHQMKFRSLMMEYSPRICII